MQNFITAVTTTSKLSRKESSELVTANSIAFADSTVQKLDALSAKRDAWEQEIFKKANEELYSLLADALDLYYHSEAIIQSLEIKAHGKSYTSKLRTELTARLKELGVKVQNNSTTLTMLVRYVFKSDRKRAHGYSQVLGAAIQDNVQPVDLAVYITNAGGVEQIKRRMVLSEEALAKRAKVAIAKDTVKADLEHAELNPIASAQVAVEGEYAVLLAKPRPDGFVDIIGVVPDVNDALLNALQLRMAKKRVELGGIEPVGTVIDAFDVPEAANDTKIAVHA